MKYIYVTTVFFLGFFSLETAGQTSASSCSVIDSQCKYKETLIKLCNQGCGNSAPADEYSWEEGYTPSIHSYSFSAGVCCTFECLSPILSTGFSYNGIVFSSHQDTFFVLSNVQETTLYQTDYVIRNGQCTHSIKFNSIPSNTKADLIVSDPSGNTFYKLVAPNEQQVSNLNLDQVSIGSVYKVNVNGACNGIKLKLTANGLEKLGNSTSRRLSNGALEFQFLD